MMSGDTAGVIYLGLIGVAAGSYVLVAYRGRMGAMLQHIMIWVLVFFGLLIAYGFKDTLQSQLYPRQGVAVSENTIALPRARDGHFYADVLVNNQRISFLVDTGASGIVLRREDAEKIGIHTAGLNYFGTAYTANGKVRTAFVKLDTMELAGIRDFDITASVTDGDMDISLLGMAYLDRFERFEITGDQLRLHR